ncbi:uncharacterized protein J7T54_005452 [Emericellopsis cladophorae]|uniref:Plasma membrane channel protein n=1 Tax=Emericellopsis cladophorae TaxID=2686198 RepID=A0A9Q0BDA5_9HYPO|nr:uncharacterized protein J7T54_005452 [Emericellopsis cladophorae]KAI6780350.1 hypothetical protein J7T54_005452 [Emericellopsis cladophorae]
MERYNDKYVIVYDFKNVDTETAEREVTVMIDDLETAGLLTEARAGYEQTLLVFVKAPRELLGKYVYRSRVKDWLYGIVQTHPGGTKDSVVDGDFEAEDLLSVYHLVNWPKDRGGAGITPGLGQWENVTSIFPLHNEAANQALLKHVSRRLFLTNEDLDRIRDLHGSKVAFYFAFIQTYLVCLAFPAVTGVLTWYLGGRYSLTYAILTCVWCTVTLEYWKVREVDLSIRWRVRNVASVKVNRPQFRWERIVVDGAGEPRHHFPRHKQVLRHLLQIPFIALSAALLGALIVAVFALEILLSESYTGGYPGVVEYVPTIMLALVLPRINGLLERVAEAITDYENHRTADHYEMSLTQKNFVLSIITNYLPILITAFVYVPFGDEIVPWLSAHTRSLLGQLGQRFLAEGEGSSHAVGGVVDATRLRDEVIALALTGQVSSFFEENVLPVAKRKLHAWYRTYRAPTTTMPTTDDVEPFAQEEARFLRSARDQATRTPYDVQEDIAEIVLQFGYLALFSPVWPLISIGFLVNNIVELRTDLLKIAMEHQRPAPVRSDGIGPWISSLDFLTWAGSLTTGAIVHLFGASSIGAGAWWALPITIFISEHVFMGFRSLVRYALQRVGSAHIRRERDERYALRARYLREMEAGEAEEQRRRGGGGAQLSVAEKERRKSVRIMGGEAFFTRQMEHGASTAAGLSLIRACRGVGAVGEYEDDKSHLD